MTKANSTVASHRIDPRFKDLTAIDILKLMTSHAEEIGRQGEKINAVAYGGAARAGKLNDQGDPVDCVSFHIFNAITDIGGDSYNLIQLKDAIAELAYREMIAQAKT